MELRGLLSSPASTCTCICCAAAARGHAGPSAKGVCLLPLAANTRQGSAAPRHPNAGGAQLSQESAIPCRAGSLLVTAGGTDLCFWQLLQSGQLVQRVTAHQKTITSVVVAALASSQPHVVSAGLDGHVKVSRMRMALTRCRHLQRSRHASPALALCR